MKNLRSTPPLALDSSGMPVASYPFMPGNGLVGGFQAMGWECAEHGCDFIFISALGYKSRTARCPRHKKESK